MPRTSTLVVELAVSSQKRALPNVHRAFSVNPPASREALIPSRSLRLRIPTPGRFESVSTRNDRAKSLDHDAYAGTVRHYYLPGIVCGRGPHINCNPLDLLILCKGNANALP